MARKLVSGTRKSCGAGPRVLTSFPLCLARHCLPRGPAVLGAQACSFGSGGSMFAGAGKRRFVVESRLLCSRPASVPVLGNPSRASGRGQAPGARPLPSSSRRSSSPQSPRVPRRLVALLVAGIGGGAAAGSEPPRRARASGATPFTQGRWPAVWRFRGSLLAQTPVHKESLLVQTPVRVTASANPIPGGHC